VEYVISLFAQQAMGASPGDTALTLLPVTVGIMVSGGGIMALGLIEKIGRLVIGVGILITLAGVAGLLAVNQSSGASASLWALTGPLFVCGLGMGACYGTIFNFALGDVEPETAGGASGAISAVQQVANGIGSAAITSIYLAMPHNQSGALQTSLITVLVATAACLPLVALLPNKAAPEQEEALLAAMTG
jgi:fucose permease